MAQTENSLSLRMLLVLRRKKRTKSIFHEHLSPSVLRLPKVISPKVQCLQLIEVSEGSGITIQLVVNNLGKEVLPNVWILRADLCKYRESDERTKISNFFLFHQKNLFNYLFSKIKLKVLITFYFFLIN